MKRIMVSVLICTLIVMTGCNQKNDTIKSNEISSEVGQSTVSSSENAEKVLQDILKEENTTPAETPKKEDWPVSINLTVPIHIVTMNDNFKAYDNGKKGDLFVNDQEKIQAVQEFMKNLDYSTITAMYGVAEPYFEYSQSDMSLEDSLFILENLEKSVETLKLMPEELNPYTGGGHKLSIHQGENITTFLFNGGWLTVSFQNEQQQWIFDVDETPAQDLLSKNQNLLFDNMDKGEKTSDTIIYQGSEIESFWAVDIENYVMAQITEPSQIRIALKEFETMDYNRTDFNGLGFLLFNGDGKQYHYLHDTDTELILAKTAKASLTNALLHPSWLIHFTPERVVSINSVTDQEKIKEFCDFLKNEVTTGNAIQVLDAPVNPTTTMGDFSIRMKFDSNVEYHILGTDYFDGTGNISIYTSDLHKTISYQLDNGVAQKITEFLKNLN